MSFDTAVTIEPRHEKPGFLFMRKQRRRSATGDREADQRLCFRYIIIIIIKSLFQEDDIFSKQY